MSIEYDGSRFGIHIKNKPAHAVMQRRCYYRGYLLQLWLTAPDSVDFTALQMNRCVLRSGARSALRRWKRYSKIFAERRAEDGVAVQPYKMATNGWRGIAKAKVSMTMAFI